MNRQEMIQEYLEFKKDCVDKEIFDLWEIQKLFELWLIMEEAENN